MTVEVGQLRAGQSRLLYSGLVASLAINLLFVGLFGSAAWERVHERSKPGEPGLLGFVGELPSERQDAVRDQIVAAREALKDLRAQVRSSWLDANALLAEPFDKAKFAAALASLAELEAKYKAGLNTALADTADKLSPDERKLLQSWREKRRLKLLARSGESAKDGVKGD